MNQIFESADVLLAKLRNAGWSVAIHNDYRAIGRTHTFWLFTSLKGRWVKGEGLTDEFALRECWSAAQEISAHLPPVPCSVSTNGYAGIALTFQSHAEASDFLRWAERYQQGIAP